MTAHFGVLFAHREALGKPGLLGEIPLSVGREVRQGDRNLRLEVLEQNEILRKQFTLLDGRADSSGLFTALETSSSKQVLGSKY